METESVTVLESLISDAQAKRKKIDGEVTDLEERLKLLRRERTILSEEEAVLTNILARQSSKADNDINTVEQFGYKLNPTPAVALTTDWSRAKRSDAVAWAVAELTEAKGFATPGEVEDLLKSRNRVGDNRDYIGSTLAHLRRANKVHTQARAEWVYGPELVRDHPAAVVPN